MYPEVTLARSVSTPSSCDYRPPTEDSNPSIASTPPLSGSPAPKQLRTRKFHKKLQATARRNPLGRVQLLSNGSVYVLGRPRDARPINVFGMAHDQQRRTKVLTSRPYSKACIPFRIPPLTPCGPVSGHAVSVLVRGLPILVHANSRLGGVRAVVYMD
jgi:hypothetical protein